MLKRFLGRFERNDEGRCPLTPLKKLFEKKFLKNFQKLLKKGYYRVSGGVTAAGHPAKRLLDAGLRVTISTDNMTLAATTLDEEYCHCLNEMGFTRRDLVQMNIYAAEAAFLDEAARAALIEKLKPYL